MSQLKHLGLLILGLGFLMTCITGSGIYEPFIASGVALFILGMVGYLEDKDNTK